MIARKLRPEEVWRSRLNMAVAFSGFFDMEQEREKSKTEEADPTADHWGAFPEGEKYPAASLVMNHYIVRFDGHRVQMGGVGGVASLPENRRGGAIRECMKAAFRDLYDRGVLFSALYPFNSAYYRKFGYEVGEYSICWDIALPDLRLPSAGGKITQLFPGDDLSPLLTAYNRMYGGVNLSVDRREFDKGLEKENFFEKRRSVFLWEDETGTPAGCLIGTPDGDMLNCQTEFGQRNALLFRDGKALRALLAFVHQAFIANFETIRFSVPGFLDIRTILPEVGNAREGRISLNGSMLRLVDAERGLKLCKCKGEGSVVLAVTDPLLPENNDTFRLTFASGRENLVERVKEAPQIALGIGDLSTLLCGVKDAGELPWMQGVAVSDPQADYSGVFYKKPCHILDLF